MTLSTDGKTLCTAGADKTIKVWDMAKIPPALRSTLTGHEDRVRGLAASLDGKQLFSTSDRDKTIRIWSLGDKPKEEKKLMLKEGARCVAVSPDGESLSAGCLDGTVLTWKLGEKLAEPTKWRVEKGSLYSLVYAPDSKGLLGVVKWDAVEDRFFLWDVEGKEQMAGKYSTHIEAGAFDPGGRRLLIVNETSLFVVKRPE